MFKRTHTCGELRKEHIGESVSLNGWVNTVRLHGQVIFIDLRDRYGKTQIVFNSEDYDGDFETIKKLSMEDVLSIKGKVQSRGENAVNPDILTGEIEVIVEAMELLSETAPLPFVITNRNSALEDLRLKYRYLELRTDELQHNIITSPPAVVLQKFPKKKWSYYWKHMNEQKKLIQAGQKLPYNEPKNGKKQNILMLHVMKYHYCGR